MGTPRRAVLKRVCRSCFEPRRGRDPTGGLFVQKPTASGGKAFWRPPAGPRDATSRGRASASHPHSGQSVLFAVGGFSLARSLIERKTRKETEYHSGRPSW